MRYDYAKDYSGPRDVTEEECADLNARGAWCWEAQGEHVCCRANGHKGRHVSLRVIMDLDADVITAVWSDEAAT